MKTRAQVIEEFGFDPDSDIGKKPRAWYPITGKVSQMERELGLQLGDIIVLALDGQDMRQDKAAYQRPNFVATVVDPVEPRFRWYGFRPLVGIEVPAGE